jgi:hypothetical protein
MLGVHVYKPNDTRNFYRSNSKEFIQPSTYLYGLEDYEIVIMYLSILNWKKFNGPINLYTTLDGYDVFDKLQILPFYNKVDVDILSQQNEKYNIDHRNFWAACKIQLINQLPAPFTILDLDLYVETDLEQAGFFTKQLGVLHFEKHSLSYPFPYTIPGYNLPEDWSWDSYPVNSALVYFGDNEFKTKYTEASLNFMHNNEGKFVMDKINARMIFAEQRLLGEMIKQHNVEYVNIIDGLYYPYHDTDNCYGFTDVMNVRTARFIETDDGLHKHSNIKEVEHYINHLWGFKINLLNDNVLRMKFVTRLLEKVIKDFPQHYDAVRNSLEIMYKTSNFEYAKYFDSIGKR